MYVGNAHHGEGVKGRRELSRVRSPFHYPDPRDRTQDIRLGNDSFHRQCHLVSTQLKPDFNLYPFYS